MENYYNERPPDFDKVFHLSFCTVRNSSRNNRSINNNIETKKNWKITREPMLPGRDCSASSPKPNDPL
jgi:hypothetical protein